MNHLGSVCYWWTQCFYELNCSKSHNVINDEFHYLLNFQLLSFGWKTPRVLIICVVIAFSSSLLLYSLLLSTIFFLCSILIIFHGLLIIQNFPPDHSLKRWYFCFLPVIVSFFFLAFPKFVTPNMLAMPFFLWNS